MDVYLYQNNLASTSMKNESTLMKYTESFEDYELGSLALQRKVWSKHPENPVLTRGSLDSWDSYYATFASVIWDEENEEFRMYYQGSNGKIEQVGLATSKDGIHWTKYENNPVVPVGPSGAWDSKRIRVPMVWKEDGTYHMIYTGGSGSGHLRIGYAYSNDGIHWTKYENNPVLDHPLLKDTENWGIVKVGETYYLWVSDFTRRIAYATSKDLLHWKPSSKIIFEKYPGTQEENHFCPFSFKYKDYYYILVPSYNASRDWAKHFLFRCKDPTFPEEKREFVRIAIETGSPNSWDERDLDTPQVLTLNVERTQFFNEQLWVYYAGYSPENSWGMGLVIEEDLEKALEPKLVWDVDEAGGNVTVVNSPSYAGERSLKLEGKSSASATLNVVEYLEAKVWMMKTSENGKLGVYILFGDEVICGVELAQGFFHYWDGKDNICKEARYAPNMWYQVHLKFNYAEKKFDFIIYDENMNKVVAKSTHISLSSAVKGINKIRFFADNEDLEFDYVDDLEVFTKNKIVVSQGGWKYYWYVYLTVGGTIGVLVVVLYKKRLTKRLQKLLKFFSHCHFYF